MLKILHVITGLERGGAETVLYRILSNKTELPNQYHIVVSLTTRGYYAEKLESAGVPVYSLGISFILDLPRAFFKLISIMRHVRPNLVQTWLYHADLLGGLSALFCGRPPVIWSIHTVNIDSNSSPFTKIVRKICALTSSTLPSVILCVANASVESHISLGYNSNNMRVIPNGFDLPDIKFLQPAAHALRNSFGFNSEHHVVGCIGRFHPDKDYSTFLLAASLLKERMPNVRFLLIGSALTNQNQKLMEWIVDADLQNHVVLIGERNDISVCLLTFDVFCLPSKTEAFPLVLGEAMAAARPVISTNVGDAALLVGDTGVIVPPGDAEKLCDGLQMILENSPKFRQDLGIASRNRIEREFSMELMIKRIQNLYFTLYNCN